MLCTDWYVTCASFDIVMYDESTTRLRLVYILHAEIVFSCRTYLIDFLIWNCLCINEYEK